MINEIFLDKCIDICCSNKISEKKSGKLFESVMYTLDWYSKEVVDKEKQTEFINKFELAKYICKYRMENKTFSKNNLLLRLSEGKFKELINILDIREDDEEKINEDIKLVISKRKMLELMEGKNKLDGLIKDISTCNYVDDIEIIDRWKNLITRSWDKISEFNNIEKTEKVQALDLLNGDYSPVIEKIKTRYNPTNIIKSGLNCIDKLFPAGGFEISRFYLIAGTSGVGKSTLLDNFACNAATSEHNKTGDAYLILTGENLIDETLERVYCQLTKMPHSKMLAKLFNDPSFSIEKEIKTIMNKHNSDIILQYFKSGLTTTEDIRLMIEDYSSKYRMRAVYVDYLDLVRSKYRLDELRLDLGQSIMDLKNIAIEYNIPVISASQLNKTGYDKKSEASPTSISESMKKIDNSDFVLFLQPHEQTLTEIETGNKKLLVKKIKVSSIKNRNGEVDASTDVMMINSENGKKVFNYTFEEVVKHDDSAILSFI